MIYTWFFAKNYMIQISDVFSALLMIYTWFCAKNYIFQILDGFSELLMIYTWFCVKKHIFQSLDGFSELLVIYTRFCVKNCIFQILDDFSEFLVVSPDFHLHFEISRFSRIPRGFHLIFICILKFPDFSEFLMVFTWFTSTFLKFSIFWISPEFLMSSIHVFDFPIFRFPTFSGLKSGKYTFGLTFWFSIFWKFENRF